MHRTNADWEAGARPTPELMAKMGALIESMNHSEVFLGGEGLQPSANGVRLAYSGGTRTVTKGPFTPSNELIAGFCQVRTPTIEDAVVWADRFAAVVGDVEIDIRPMTEPWDLGVCPKPEGLSTTRFMMMHKADVHSEAGRPPAPEMMAAMGKLMEDLVQSGCFIAGEGLTPSARGTRLRFSKGTCSMTDGPFTESKELIAGYCMLQVKSRDEAIEWARRFADVIGDVEVDLRPLHEHEDCG